MMASGRRLLILSCSQRKRPDPGLLPAIKRYDGPAFWVLRHFLREQPDCSQHLDVFILSAYYGLIQAYHPIIEYNQVMTPSRAIELHDEVLASFASLFRIDYTDLCLAMSKKYLKALEGWPTLLRSDVRSTIVSGSQGTRLTQLKHWLWQEAQSAD
jgi:hypothetical protein